MVDMYVSIRNLQKDFFPSLSTFLKVRTQRIIVQYEHIETDCGNLQAHMIFICTETLMDLLMIHSLPPEQPLNVFHLYNSVPSKM